jgi:hypothetical protein
MWQKEGGAMKKLGMLALMLLVGMAILGLGYAKWSETLTIDGTVNTGEVDWEFSSFSILDSLAPPNEEPDYNTADGFVGDFWQVDKNVGWAEGELVDSDGDGDKDTFALTFYNVYPSYFNEISVYAHNNGTIPIIIDRVLINGTELKKSPTPVVKLDLTNDGKPDVEVWWGNGFGVQLEPSNRSPEMSFWFHVLQDAPEGETLHFNISIEAIQWNEYVSP